MLPDIAGLPATNQPAGDGTRASVFEVGMAVLSLASVLLIGWVELADIEWPSSRFRLWAWLDLPIVIIFSAEYIYRLWKADDRREYLRHHWYDLPGLVPLFVEALPWFQEAGALRFLRVIRILRLLRALPAVRRLYRRTRFLQRVISESHLARLLSLVAILIALTSIGFWIVEPRTTVHDFDDAVWCAVGTFTTAGFVEPQTGAGRIIATIVMLLGMATGTAVATALVTTTLRLREEERPARTLENLEALRAADVLTAEQFQAAHSRLLLATLDGLHADGVLSEEDLAAGRDRMLGTKQPASASPAGDPS